MNTDQIYDVIEMLVPLTGQACENLGEESPLCKLLLSHLELMLLIQASRAMEVRAEDYE